MPDPRGHSNAERHTFHEILIIALCATLCGAEAFTEMEEFGKAKIDWLRSRLGLVLAHGIPSHDTFGRLFAALDPEEFGEFFRRWTKRVQHLTGGQVIAIDGKTLRRSFDKAAGCAAVHMVSAWASRSRLVLAQQAVRAKSNEITAIPALLKMLDLAGCIVTVDALNCQKEIAAQILAQEGHYLLALKENHPWLYEDVAAYFHWGLKRLEKGAAVKTHFASHASSRDYEHGRSEERRCWCVDATSEEWAEARKQWPGLRSFILVESDRRLSQCEGGVNQWTAPTRERRYFLSSLAPDAKRALESVREHWGIENSVHWVLDVAFQEDNSRIRKDNAGPNMATLRHLTLNLLRQDTLHKRGIKSRRLRAGWDNDYLLKILVGPNS